MNTDSKPVKRGLLHKSKAKGTKEDWDLGNNKTKPEIRIPKFEGTRTSG